ncbi:MAG TPA: radical SAM/SPASM domain-containing protein [Thermoanaerobaculia bacterium]|nr:radical SAM/SPASM domain-containing protein [Thermoanaerobaculia bacterium]
MTIGASHGWAEISKDRKREIIEGIASGRATRGPVHAELDLTDRCNVACYFCNQQDVRTKEFIGLPRITEILDQLVEGGLKSVRLSGGGDPLFHKDIALVIDLLGQRGIVIDNLTTNAVLLGPEIASRLVRDRAREVVISLNAVNPADYQRMMQVKPALFDRVVANARHLVSIRTEGYPFVVCQFLLDRGNFASLVEMYELGVSLGADRIAVNPVMDIPRERIDNEILLTLEDRELLRPLLEDVLRRDQERKLLQISFPYPVWNQMLEEVRAKVNYETPNQFPTAPTFKEENGQCFFGWYSMTIRGNGDLYPCCLLMNPDYEPLGNLSEGRVEDHWKGAFGRVRRDMREVMLGKGRVFYRPNRFKTLRKQCIEPYACWLKNMYFRGDEEFYKDLGVALDAARAKEVRWAGTPRQMIRALEGVVHQNRTTHRAYDRLRVGSRPLREWIKRKTKWNVAGISVRPSKS